MKSLPISNKLSLRRSLGVFAAVYGLSIGSVLANPSGAQVVHGNVGFSQNGTTLNIHSQSPLSIINWQNFNIGAGERVNIYQGSAGDLSVNRVVGASRSMIDGALWSNGRVLLINPNGLTISQGGSIDVASFTASTLNQSDADILAGRGRFTGSSQAADVLVLGQIRARNGDIYLLGRTIENRGALQAPQGKAILAAGEQIEITGSGLNNIIFKLQNRENQVRNLGSIEAGAAGLFAGSLQHSGQIRATGISQDANGQVVLHAGPAGSVTVTGEVLARNSQQQGGVIHVLGQDITLADQATLDASGALGGGTILVGGDWQGQNTQIQQAERVNIGAQTRLLANATGTGNGGKVVVWSTGQTDFLGQIEARGAGALGRGGQVETSGKTMTIAGRVDTRGPAGAGTWLIDPTILCLAASAGTCNAGETELLQSTLNTNLAMTNVSQSASDYIYSNGNVAIDLQGNGLTLSTYGSGTGTGSQGINLTTTRVVDSSSSANGWLALATSASVRNADITVGDVSARNVYLKTNTGNITGAGTLKTDNLYAHTGSGNVSFSRDDNKIKQFSTMTKDLAYQTLTQGSVGGDITLRSQVDIALGDATASARQVKATGAINVSTVNGADINVKGAVITNSTVQLKADRSLIVESQASITANEPAIITAYGGAQPNTSTQVSTAISLEAKNGISSSGNLQANNGKVLLKTTAGDVTASRIDAGELQIDVVGSASIADLRGVDGVRVYGKATRDLSIQGNTAGAMTLGGSNGESLQADGTLFAKNISTGTLNVTQKVQGNEVTLKTAGGNIYIGEAGSSAQVVAPKLVTIETEGTGSLYVYGNANQQSNLTTTITSGIFARDIDISAANIEVGAGTAGREGAVSISGKNSVKIVARNGGQVSVNGGNSAGSSAVIGSDRGGRVTIAAGGITLSGGSGNRAHAAIGSFIDSDLGFPLGLGTLELNAQSLTLRSNGSDALIVTQRDRLTGTLASSITGQPANYPIFQATHPDRLTNDGVAQMGWLQVSGLLTSQQQQQLAQLIENRTSSLSKGSLNGEQNAEEKKQSRAPIKVGDSDAECR
ncbi:filamentous hemagglutinin N-terminal domain-containing protein [Parvibium lacunae]|uniref:Filamentous hemagglutinin N-terminal domain-containing protein n=1 Tax=Parvibium lacunae TaxID=1888893 RepID=A0A368L4Z0_9BURK|nr:filamentous hemagglutinin N-terminal domain-containing protein [Parvibium lacunae]RCS58651.1 filamentous hemagglutinin N-terminal domain-containing protein [Parvibium lacunae]